MHDIRILGVGGRLKGLLEFRARHTFAIITALVVSKSFCVMSHRLVA